MAQITVENVSKRFRGRGNAVTALQNINIEAKDGEFLVFIGPSGCGKSTLLNIIAGLDTADEGRILEDGRITRGPGRDRTVVFQDGGLFPWLTAQKNVEFGLKQMGLSPKERAERAARYLDLVHLSRFRNSYLHELSGGMKQRVSIARALALEPEALLMDEPFSALDAQTREDLYGVLQEIRDRVKPTIIFVTHNAREAACLGDRVILFATQPGRVQATFPIQLARPRFVDDVDVVKLAQQMSLALKNGLAQSRGEEYDADWQPAQRESLRAGDGVSGDHI